MFPTIKILPEKVETSEPGSKIGPPTEYFTATFL